MDRVAPRPADALNDDRRQRRALAIGGGRMFAGRGLPLGLGHAGLGLPVGTGASVRLTRAHGCDEPLQYFQRGLRSATDRANSQAAARGSYGNGDSRALPAARGNRGRGEMPSKRTDLELDAVLAGRATRDRNPDLVDA